MSHRNDFRALTFALVALFTAAKAEAVRCPSDVKTNIVYVKFQGCSSAQPGLQFEVRVGDETITVSKRAAGDPYWTGETKKLFVIDKAPLAVRADAMPAARAACKTEASGLKQGPCVAEFIVQCEPLWLLKLDKTGKASVRSARKNTTIEECPDDPFKELTGPGEVELTVSEKLVVTLAQERASDCLEASIAYKPFKVNTPFRLSDLHLTPICSGRSTMNDTHAQEDLVKQQALKLFPHVIFIKTLPKKVAEE